MNENLEKLEKQLEVFRRVFKGNTTSTLQQREGKKKTKPKLLLGSETVFRKISKARVYNLYGKRLIPGVKEFLTYPPNVIVPKHFIDVERVSSELFTRDAPHLVHLLQQPYISNGATSLAINDLPAKAQEKVFFCPLS